jgi:membrane protease YdiL (CAAX protease family)
LEGILYDEPVPMTDTFWKLQVRPVPWSLGDAGLGSAIVLVGVFVASLVLIALGITGPGATGQDTAVTLFVTGLVAVLMIGAAWALGVRKHGGSLASLGFTMPHERTAYLLAAVALGVSIGFTALYSTVVSALGVEILQPPDIDDSFLAGGGNVVFSALVLAVLGPLGEEVFFRGFLFGALAQRMRVASAILVSAAVFALLHMEVGVLIPIFVTGLLLTWLYAKTGSLLPALLAHIGQNLLALAVAV